MYVCKHACVYIYMYVRMYVCICMYVHIKNLDTENLGGSHPALLHPQVPHTYIWMYEHMYV